MSSKRDRILEVMINILRNKEDLEQITVRQIAQRADVNLALINYYFGSKDNLIQEAVSKVMEHHTSELLNHITADTAKEKIINFTLAIADFTLANYFVSKYAIQYDMMNGSLNTVMILLEPLRKYYGDTKTDLELKLLAMQIVVPMQSLFLNAKEFQNFAYVDVFSKETRDKLLIKIIENIL